MSAEELESTNLTIPEPGFNPRYTFAVDLVGPVPYTYTQAILSSFPSTSSLEGRKWPLTLRLHIDTKYRYLITEKVERPQSLTTSATTLVHHLPFPLLFRRQFDNPAMTIKAPHDTISVYNITIHPDDTLECFLPSLVYTGGHRAVYIFHPSAAPCFHRIGCSNPFSSRVRDGAEMLQWLAETIASQMAHGTRFTVVNVHNIPPAWLCNEFSDSFTPAEDLIVRIAINIPKSALVTGNENGEELDDFDTHLNYVRSRLTFKSLGEYRAGLNTSSRLLETEGDTKV
jgi:hypothetical protein